MKFIQGINRDQIYLFPVSLEESIGQDNVVRVVDVFVESLPFKELGFKVDFVENGRPAYHPKDLLKLFLYGYLNRTRSSRELEKECKRNIEVMWLLKGLQPDHNTISNFRRDNPKAIKKVFRCTVQIAKNHALIGGTLIAGDSTKFRAQNSKKNNYNEKKIERHITYIDQKLEAYMEAMASADGDLKEQLDKQIDEQIARLQKYESLEKQLKESGDTQVSTSDPESRQMIIRNNITEVAYNVQTTVDAEHCLVLDYEVTNENDSRAMGDSVTRAAEVVGNADFTALFDKGYHTGSELKAAQTLGVETIVAIPNIPSTSQAPDPAFNISEFRYHPRKDCYRCPAGKLLTTNGRWYNKQHRKKGSFIRVKHYKTSECDVCKLREKCTRNPNGRLIERSEYAEYIEQNRKNVTEKEVLYRRRQAIVEHPYGTIKRQWGFSYITTKKGKHRASADVGLMFTAYNVRRLINILGIRGLLTALLTACSYLFALIGLIRSEIRHFEPSEIFCKIFSTPGRTYPKSAYI
jgi:transposase